MGGQQALLLFKWTMQLKMQNKVEFSKTSSILSIDILTGSVSVAPHGSAAASNSVFHLAQSICASCGTFP